MKRHLKNAVVSILTWEAKAALKRHRPKIVAVTGNVGKTSTKDAVYAVISESFKARKSQKSENSEIGIPLTVLGLKNAWSSPRGWFLNFMRGFRIAFLDRAFPEWLILEIGADHPGDIESVTAWLSPDIVILTRMSNVPVHVENFRDADEVLAEKMHLARALRAGGTLIVNADDPIFGRAVRELDVAKISYGMSKGAQSRIVETEILYDGTPLSLPVGQYAKIDIGGKIRRVELRGVLGDHLMYPLAAAAAVASMLHIEDTLSTAVADLEMPKGRMRILRGAATSVVIDDTYNSSPIACAEALKTLGSLSVRGKKIALLADMKELGDNEVVAHRDIGKLAFDKVHTLAVVGELGKEIARGAMGAGMSPDRIMTFEDSLSAGKALTELLRAGDAILVKGSQSMRMERAVRELLEDPRESKAVLVRQEDEWQKR